MVANRAKLVCLWCRLVLNRDIFDFREIFRGSRNRKLIRLGEICSRNQNGRERNAKGFQWRYHLRLGMDVVPRRRGGGRK